MIPVTRLCFSRRLRIFKAHWSGELRAPNLKKMLPLGVDLSVWIILRYILQFSTVQMLFWFQSSLVPCFGFSIHVALAVNSNLVAT